MKPIWLRLTGYVLPYRRGMASIMGLTAVGILLDVLKPWPMKWIVDDVLGKQEIPATTVPWIQNFLEGMSLRNLLAVLALATIVLFMMGEVVKFARSYISATVGGLAKYRLSSELLDHLQRLSLIFLRNHKTGDLIKRISEDSDCVKELVLEGSLSIFTSIATLTAIGSVMFHLDGRMSMIALFVSPFQVVLMRLFNTPMVEAAYKHQQLEGEIMTMTEQTLSTVPVIQAFLREEHEDERFKSLTTKTLRAYLESLFTQLKFSIAIGSVSAIGTAAMMLFGGLSVVHGQMTLGVFVVFLSYLVSLYEPMETLAYLSSSFANAGASARRVYEILDSNEYVHESKAALSLGAYCKDTGCGIVIKDVHFGYKTRQPILKGVTLEVRPGETIAIVGASGAGKSTLVSLLPRLFDPWSGQVLLDGIDIRMIQLRSLRSLISMVLQESFLLPISIRDNISYGRPGATSKEIVAAAEAANADSFIRKLPRGYDTVIGERGGTLSGGQKQRLAIARALLKDTPVLILDEPTAALDAQTEALMMQAIERLKAGRTTLIIAHRLATVCNADQIVVLSDGVITERGSHQELLERNGYYKRLHFLSTAQ